MSEMMREVEELANWASILGMDWLREVRRAPEMTMEMLGQRERGENLKRMAELMRDQAATIAAQSAQIEALRKALELIAQGRMPEELRKDMAGLSEEAWYSNFAEWMQETASDALSTLTEKK